MSQEHISRQFDADLEGLRTRVLAMGGLVEQQVLRAMEGLESGDMSEAILLAASSVGLGILNAACLT